MRRPTLIALVLAALGCRPDATAQTPPSTSPAAMPPASMAPSEAARFAVVPWPQTLVPGAGAFTVVEGTRFGAATPEARAAAEVVAAPLRRATGWTLPVVDGPADIMFVLDASATTAVRRALRWATRWPTRATGSRPRRAACA